MAATYKTLDINMSINGQSCDGSHIAARGGQRFRAVIHHDSSYAFQSDARVQMWTTEAGWALLQSCNVASLPIAQHSTYARDAHDSTAAWRGAMSVSLDQLIALGLSIIPAETATKPKAKPKATKGARA